jgi:uncharacterized membrane protein YhfC
MVQTSSIVWMLLSGVIAIAVPVAFLIYAHRKWRLSWRAVLTGVILFIVFSQILEKLLHVYILRLNPITMEWLKAPFIYAVYGGLAAGVFEETARLIGFRFLLKHHRKWKDGIAYGIGHGGAEALLIGAFGGVQTIVFAFLINSGNFDALIQQAGQGGAALAAVKDQLVHAPSVFFALGGLERISAFALQLALSVLVLLAVKSGKWIYFFLAVLIHAALDFVAALYQVLHFNLFVVEGFFLFAAICSVVFIVKSNRFI